MHLPYPTTTGHMMKGTGYRTHQHWQVYDVDTWVTILALKVRMMDMNKLKLHIRRACQFRKEYRHSYNTFDACFLVGICRYLGTDVLALKY